MAGRPRKYLSREQLKTVDQAVSVSEEVTSDRFHLTLSSWKKYRYDIRTLRQLEPQEITSDIFAQIVRYGPSTLPHGLREGDFYRICLQDHNILSALRREPQLELYPLLIYVVAHELVHIVRFYKFFQFFHADEAERAAEEARVHRITFDMLKKIKIPGMPLIFTFYSQHRELVR
ncbi:MAG: hypothetical protein AB1896_03035 [Thermodesulfobacteriota bacterium]